MGNVYVCMHVYACDNQMLQAGMITVALDLKGFTYYILTWPATCTCAACMHLHVHVPCTYMYMHFIIIIIIIGSKPFCMYLHVPT